jgi:hypothetical protein
MENNLMKVIAIGETLQDKNGNDYRMVTLQNPTHKTIVDEESGEVLTLRQPALKATKSAYDESYLDGTKEWLADAKEGEVVEGSVEKRPVDQYEFIGREGEARVTNSYTLAVFGKTSASNWEEIVAAAFKRNGHPLAGTVNVEPAKETAKRVDITAGTAAKTTAPKAVVEF